MGNRVGVEGVDLRELRQDLLCRVLLQHNTSGLGAGKAVPCAIGHRDRVDVPADRAQLVAEKSDRVGAYCLGEILTPSSPRMLSVMRVAAIGAMAFR